MVVEIEAVAGSAGFVRVAAAFEAAVADRGCDAAGVEGVAAVAFAAVFDAEFGEFFADGRAFLHGEAVVVVRGAGQGAPIGSFGKASLVGVAARGRDNTGTGV